MKKYKILKIIVIFIVVIIVILTWKFLQNDNKNIDNSFIDTKVLGDSKDLISFSVDPGDSVGGVLNVVGSVSGGYFFEGNIILNILDSNKKLLRAINGNAKGEWMTSGPVGFDAVLDFTKLPKGHAYIEIHNDNASGLPENDKSVIIPIVIK